jgi:hypothetical protein
VLSLILGAAIVIAGTVASWPSHRLEGWVLLVIVALSMLPVILLLVQTLATRGGTFQVAGLSLSFAQVSEKVASTLRVTTLAENLGTTEDAPVTGSSLRSILRALRRAHDSEVTVVDESRQVVWPHRSAGQTGASSGDHTQVDIRRGRTRWETRLFILVSGAARRDRGLGVAGAR